MSCHLAFILACPVVSLSLFYLSINVMQQNSQVLNMPQKDDVIIESTLGQSAVAYSNRKLWRLKAGGVQIVWAVEASML